MLQCNKLEWTLSACLKTNWKQYKSIQVKLPPYFFGCFQIFETKVNTGIFDFRRRKGSQASRSQTTSELHHGRAGALGCQSSWCCFRFHRQPPTSATQLSSKPEEDNSTATSCTSMFILIVKLVFHWYRVRSFKYPRIENTKAILYFSNVSQSQRGLLQEQVQYLTIY